MQTKGQLMKSPNTAFSFAPPSILSLTICKTVALIISKNHACSNLLKTRGSFVLLPLKKEGEVKIYSQLLFPAAMNRYLP